MYVKIRLMDTFGDTAAIVISTISLAVSTWVILRSSRLTRAARREWVERWKDDPEILAIVMSKLGWLERKRLTRELGL